MGFIKFIRVKSGNLKKLLSLRKAVIKVRKVAKAVTKVTKGANWRLFFFNRMCCGATTTQTNKTNKTYIWHKHIYYIESPNICFDDVSHIYIYMYMYIYIYVYIYILYSVAIFWWLWPLEIRDRWDLDGQCVLHILYIMLGSSKSSMHVHVHVHDFFLSSCP